MISKDGERKKERKKWCSWKLTKQVWFQTQFFSSALRTIFWSLNPKNDSYPQFYNTFSEFEKNSKGENALKSASYTYNRVDTGQTPAS